MANIKVISMITTVSMCVFLVPQIYEDGSPIAIGGFVLFSSTIMMQAFAQVFEGRWLWPPRTQFNSFIYGETFVLPIIAICEAEVYLEWSSNYILSDWFVWTAMIFAVALGIAAGNRGREWGAYTAAQMNSPTKIWHDFYVVPALIFVVLFPLPAMFYVPFGLYHLFACVAFAVWLVLMAEPGAAKKRNTAHVDYEWETESISARN